MDYLNPERATLHVFEGASLPSSRLLLSDVRGNVDVVQGFGSKSAWSASTVCANGERLAHPILIYAGLMAQLAHNGYNRRLAEAAQLKKAPFALDREPDGNTHL